MFINACMHACLHPIFTAPIRISPMSSKSKWNGYKEAEAEIERSDKWMNKRPAQSIHSQLLFMARQFKQHTLIKSFNVIHRIILNDIILDIVLNMQVFWRPHSMFFSAILVWNWVRNRYTCWANSAHPYCTHAKWEMPSFTACKRWSEQKGRQRWRALKWNVC